jgi:hypothetical protein
MTDRIKNSPSPAELDMLLVKAVSDAYGGLARSARFMARIVPGSSTTKSFVNRNSGVARQLSYLCESAEFPSRGLVSTEIRYYGPDVKFPYKTQYEDLNLIFLCRNEFLERDFFDSWMETINPSNTYDFSYKDDYTCQIELFQLGESIITDGNTGNNLARYKFTFEKAYPININAQPVTWADDNYHRLQVTFTFTRWRREELDSQDINSYYNRLVNDAETDRSGGTIIPKLNTI